MFFLYASWRGVVTPLILHLSIVWVEGSDWSPVALRPQRDYPVPREEEVEGNPEPNWTLRKRLRALRPRDDKTLGLAAASGGWSWVNRFFGNRLFSHQKFWWQEQRWFPKRRFTDLRPPHAAASPVKLYWIPAPWNFILYWKGLMTILDNYMFRPLLAIFRLSSREHKVLLYIYIYVCIRTLCSLEDNLKMASIYIYILGPCVLLKTIWRWPVGAETCSCLV